MPDDPSEQQIADIRTMKRYRIFSFDIDTRAGLLELFGGDESSGAGKQIRQSIIAGLERQFGSEAIDQKVSNLMDLGSKPISVVAYHNALYEQARSAFTACHYYPALTATCALGERILNQLVIGLRDEYKRSNYYKQVYRKDSFDNWPVAINALDEWGVLTPASKVAFERLNKQRNNALHYNAATESNLRADALDALKTFASILEGQFLAFGDLPWLLPSPGECYIRKEWEGNPFVRLVYLPRCGLVGYMHQVKSIAPVVEVEDPDTYDDGDISDEEFVRLRQAKDQWK